MAALRMQEEIGEKQALGQRHYMPVKVDGKLIDGIDEDLRTAGPNFDIGLWQPGAKTTGKRPMTLREIERGIGALPRQPPGSAGLPGAGADPSGSLDSVL